MSRRELTKAVVRVVGGAAVLTLAAGPLAALEDPTRPTPLGGAQSGSGAEAPAQPRWVLNYTLVSRGRDIAVINGQRLRAGDTVNGARVVRIRPGRVTLERDGRHFEISMLDASVKQPAR